MSKYEVFEGKSYRRKVRAIIVDERGEFLLIQPAIYDEGNWSFVGGGIEEDEDAKNAVARELVEEIGPQQLLALKPSIHQHRYLYSKNYRAKHNVDHDGQVADVFWVEVKNDVEVLIQRSEVGRFKWVKLAEVSKLVTVAAQREMFEAVLSEFSTSYLSKCVSS